MAKGQRSISVSEFFEKNRHLLGFGNDQRALLTTVKEAVDNSLDACEEGGITPEIWVHLEQSGDRRYKVGIQDNGPGIVKKQIPLIFGKLLYGSKFHRLRMSRGQQGIGISAAGMYGVLTTGKPVKIISKVSVRKPAHYYEIRIDTKTNNPEILNGKGDGVDIPPGEKGRKYIAKHGIEWETHYPVPPAPAEIAPSAEANGNADGDTDAGDDASSQTDASAAGANGQLFDVAAPAATAKAAPETGKEVVSGTRVTIELQGVHKRGRGSIDEYLEQTAIANPHVTLHYKDPDGNETTYNRSTTELPVEPKEIKPHPYGVELGRLQTMLKDMNGGSTMAQFLTSSFSCVTPAVARRICEGADVTTRASTKSIDRDKADAIYQSIQQTKIRPPATDCISPIGEQLLLKGLHQVVPGEFYAAATRPPGVYRGNPFQIEVALAYGGNATSQKVPRDVLDQMLDECDARTLRKFLVTSFSGLGPEAADKILKETKIGTRKSPSKLKKADVDKLHDAMHNVNLEEGQSMQVMRFANRVPLQFQPKACSITKAVMGTNWRSYGLSQSRGQLPNAPVTIMVHVASVWVPFTSESKEAVADYPEIEKELRLGLQAAGRKLSMYLRRRLKVKAEGERRSKFMRYLGVIAESVSRINASEEDVLYSQLVELAKLKTADADVELDEDGRPIEEAPEDLDLGDNVLIVNQSTPGTDSAGE